jgi:hypothetical protein
LDRDHIARSIENARLAVQAAGVDALCLRSDDLDGDGEREWIGTNLATGNGTRLAAFVLDGDVWYELAPLEGSDNGLGRAPACDVEIRDVNGDGIREILVWGQAEPSTRILHVFAWDGGSYALLSSFEGNAGIRVISGGEVADGIAVTYKVRHGFAWEVEYAWDGAAYGWIWDRYVWLYPREAHVYTTDTPEYTVISYYVALGERDLVGAYSLLSDASRGAQSYDEWIDQFATVVSIEAGSVQELPGATEGSATVGAYVRVCQNTEGRTRLALWDVEWQAVSGSAGWRLLQGTPTLLSEQDGC